MLTRLVVGCYASLLEAALWLSLAFSAVSGYHLSIPALSALGLMPSPEFPWRLLGAVIFAFWGFLLLAVATGPLLILLDIRQAIRGIEAKSGKAEQAQSASPRERKEPSIT